MENPILIHNLKSRKRFSIQLLSLAKASFPHQMFYTWEQGTYVHICL